MFCPYSFLPTVLPYSSSTASCVAVPNHIAALLYLHDRLVRLLLFTPFHPCAGRRLPNYTAMLLASHHCVALPPPNSLWWSPLSSLPWPPAPPPSSLLWTRAFPSNSSLWPRALPRSPFCERRPTHELLDPCHDQPTTELLTARRPCQVACQGRQGESLWKWKPTWVPTGPVLDGGGDAKPE